MAEPNDKPKLVHVEIFGQTYAIRAGAEPGYVEQLAAYVDSEMREISRSGGAVDSVRIAVLAALNIADACFQLRGARQEAESAARQRAHKLASELAQAIEE
jgi:cell division protein ZapA